MVGYLKIVNSLSIDKFNIHLIFMCTARIVQLPQKLLSLSLMLSCSNVQPIHFFALILSLTRSQLLTLQPVAEPVMRSLLHNKRLTSVLHVLALTPSVSPSRSLLPLRDLQL